MTLVGYVIIAAFCIILFLAIKSDKNANKKFDEEFEKNYQVNDMYGDMFITGKGELLYKLSSGTMTGYKKWNMSEIGYIGTGIGKHRKEFSLYDHNMNVMPGEYLTASKKKRLKEYGYKQFDIGVGKDIDGYVDFVIKHASHVQRIAQGEVVE